jgi:quercetin dioxygenase-like cupin family protein
MKTRFRPVLSAFVLLLGHLGDPLPAATTVPATAPGAAIEAPVLAPAFATSGVNGYSSLANILTVPATTPGAAPTNRLQSSAFIWEKLAFTTSATGQRRNLSDLPTATLQNLEIHTTTLNPGQTSHPPHRHGNEEMIILLEGTLEVVLGGVTPENGRVETVGPGSVFFFAANQYHNVENKGDKPATYVVINFRTAATPRTPPDGTPSDPVPNGKLKSGIYDWAKMKAQPLRQPQDTLRDVFLSPTTTLTSLECDVFTAMGPIFYAPGSVPAEELIVVKSGKLDVTINGKTERGTPASVIFLTINDGHSIKVSEPGTTFYSIRFVTDLTSKAGRPVSPPTSK